MRYTFLYRMVIPTFLGCVALVSATLVSAQAAKEAEIAVNAQMLAAAQQPARILGSRPAQVSVIVSAIDEQQGSMTVITQSRMIGQDVPMKLKIAPGFSVDRQDAITKDGVVIGAKPLTPATIGEIRPGTRGYASIRLTDQGETFVQYLLIGDPFPRP